VIFYPLYNQMAFIDAGLQMSQGYEIIWILDYGFKEYGNDWLKAYGYITDSAGTGALGFVLLVGVWAIIRKRMWSE
jgi:hypothetical protein